MYTILFLLSNITLHSFYYYILIPYLEIKLLKKDVHSELYFVHGWSQKKRLELGFWISFD